jgi:hypothetical protein
MSATRVAVDKPTEQEILLLGLFMRSLRDLTSRPARSKEELLERLAGWEDKLYTKSLEAGLVSRVSSSEMLRFYNSSSQS